MLLNVKVFPGSKKFEIRSNARGINVYLENEAERGKANVELERRFSEILGIPVRILRGLKSQRKTLEVNCDAKQVTEKLGIRI